MGLQLDRAALLGSEAAERGAPLPARHRLAPARARRISSDGRLGSGHRSRDPRAARDEIEDLFRLGDGVRRSAEQPGRPGRPGLPRRAAGAERGSRADGGQVRARHRREGRAPLDLRAQELLLSGFAEGLPDQPVRGPGGRQGSASPSCSTTVRSRPSASRARISRRMPASRCTRVSRMRAAST